MPQQYIPEGLSSQEASIGLKQHGLNTIEDLHKRTKLQIFFEQFHNVLTLLLIVAGTLSLVIGEGLDGVLIFTIVFLNALFGLYQELKAEEAIQALKKMTVSKVRVIRDRQQIEVESQFIVPGDIVFIEEGTKVPADGIIEESINIAVNEAALTGESLPVSKKVQEEIYMGTIVSRGRGYLKVMKTGMKTQFGQIAAQLSTMEEKKTPLQIKLEHVTQIIGIVGIITSMVVMGLSFWQGTTYFQAFLLGISLAVAIVPEGLPAVMTITMAIGLKTMANRKAVLRKLSAIEALGSITVIATDKTGTLTRNEMRVTQVYLNHTIYPVKKLGILKHEALEKLILNGMLCSTASLVKKGNGYSILGDPTEGALLLLATDLKKDPLQERKHWQLLKEKPFDSDIKRMSVSVSNGKDTYEFSKGAPESIFKITTKILVNGKKVELTKALRQEINDVQKEWSEDGYRVLAFAYDGVFQGMMAIHDPPRAEAADAIAKAHKAGIRVIMVTGDNPITAQSIGESIGLVTSDHKVLTGEDIDSLTDAQLKKVLPDVSIFARVSPFHKSRIVKLLQSMGEVVAVTGDGVNDAVALKQADVGVAMGRIGTDVARETADMIITDDNFATIIAAIEEGRNIIKNIQNSVKYLLSTNLSEAITIVAALALGIHTILEPVQILYINLVTDGIPALALAFSPRMNNLMERPPNRNEQLLKKVDFTYIFLIGVMASVCVLGAYQIFYTNGDSGRAKTAAFTVLALIQSFVFIDLWVSHESFVKHRKTFGSGIFIIAFIAPFILQFIILQVPFIAVIFHTTPVSFVEYLYFTAIAALIVVGYKAFNHLWKR